MTQIVMTMLQCAILAMMPVVELRAALPWAIARGLDPWLSYVLCVLFNMVPVPFILLFIRKILAWMQASRVEFFRKVATFVVEKGQRGFARVQKYATVGLFLFVAIPLPGTGAWTGSLIAALLDMKKSRALLSIVLGVLTAGIIMSLITGGVLAGLDWLI